LTSGANAPDTPEAREEPGKRPVKGKSNVLPTLFMRKLKRLIRHIAPHIPDIVEFINNMLELIEKLIN
jgi:hypothetical protein